VSIGGFFLLVLVIAAVVVLGGAVFAIAARGRRRQLSPKGGTLDARRPDEDRARPEHVEVDTEQRARFVGSR
jgi:hypothetical protein